MEPKKCQTRRSQSLLQKMQIVERGMKWAALEKRIDHGEDDVIPNQWG